MHYRHRLAKLAQVLFAALSTLSASAYAQDGALGAYVNYAGTLAMFVLGSLFVGVLHSAFRWRGWGAAIGRVFLWAIVGVVVGHIIAYDRAKAPEHVSPDNHEQLLPSSSSPSSSGG